MISVEILYQGREKSVHDERLISAAADIARVTSIFRSEKNQGLIKELNKRKFDLEIITPLTGYSNLVDVEARKRIGISMAFDINEETVDENSKRQLALTLEKLSGVVVDCKYIKDVIRNTYFFKGDIWQIPYGCDFHDFFEAASPIESELKLIVNRRWSDTHGNELVLEAIDLLKEKVRISAKFIGDGSEFNRLRQKYGSLESLGIVSFLPNLDKSQLISEFRQSWIYVSGSKSDGTSISLLEAMSAGMICVVSNFPSNEEWIENGVNGYTFTNNNAQSLAEKLFNLSKTESKVHAKMRQLAIKKAREKADWDVNKTLFQSAISKSLTN